MYDHIALSWTDLALGLPLKSRVFCERHMSDELQYRICMRCVAEHVGARPNLHVETVILAQSARIVVLTWRLGLAPTSPATLLMLMSISGQ